MKIRGRARLVGDHVSGDQIISSAYLSGGHTMEELIPYAFEACRPELGKTLQPGDVIVAGENFGCGSSREHGILILKTAGITCVIAKSFARSAYRSCINLGLLPIECNLHVNEMDAVEVEIERGILRAKGEEIAIPSYSERILRIIREGGLIPYYQNHGSLE